jgi:hypothetical protein
VLSSVCLFAQGHASILLKKQADGSYLIQNERLSPRIASPVAAIKKALGGK